MPFFTHHKQHSWPPFHATPSSKPTSSTSSTPRSSSSSYPANPKAAPENDMDVNPFSFFISPTISESDTDSEDDDFTSAGISLEKKRSRSLSPLPRRGSEINFYDEQFQMARPRSPKSVLNRFIEKHVHHIETDDEDIGGPLSRSKSFSSSLSTLGSGSPRGRPGYDFGSPSSSKPESNISNDFSRGMVITRSHSPKPRSWREPSHGLWPVIEDPEKEESLESRPVEYQKPSGGRRKLRKGNEYLFAQSI